MDTFFSIELIAQDTSNPNNIQIPSQNVVSYGKKFTISGTPHYNPSTTKQSVIRQATERTQLVDTYIFTLDTATSLGLDGL